MCIKPSYEALEKQLKELEKKYKEAENNLRLQNEITDNMAEGVVIVRAKDGSIVYANPKFEEMFGYETEEFVGKNISIVNAPNDKTPEEAAQEIIASLDKYGTWAGEIHNIKKDGTTFWGYGSISVFQHHQYGKVWLSIHTDISKRKQIEDNFKKLALFDPLTNLPNRVLFFDRLNQMLTLAKRNNQALALLFLDLDGFKKVNDSFGHDTGDIVLKKTAKKLSNCVRESDTVARIGGDEFIIILQITEPQEAAIVAEKIQNCFHKSLKLKGHEYFLSSSIGISLYPSDGNDVKSLLSNADIAMYNAKKSAHAYQYYSAEMSSRAFKRLTMENDLRRAIKHNEFVLHYQPQINIRTGQIISIEALIRWQHPELGLRYPKDFIPLSEETGLILKIDKWVMHTACNQYKAWQKKCAKIPRIAINISGQWFKQKNQIDVINNILEQTCLPSSCMELELTEGLLMENLELVMKELCKLKGNGITFAIDDFGIGYSSLGYLKHFPICKLKIDQSFIQDITTNPGDVAIIKAIITMAQTMNLKTVAEGVETPEQFELLRSLNCDEIQGFLFCKPLPADDFIQFLNDSLSNNQFPHMQVLGKYPAAQ